EVYSYDAGSERWNVWHADSEIPSDLNILEPGKAYIVRSKAPADVKIAGKQQVGGVEVPVTTKLSKGWNLIGVFSQKPVQMEDAFLTITGKYASLYEFYVDSFRKVEIKEKDKLLQPGTGYWIYATEKGEIPS
ncbi:hypothetical protein J4206_02750, partial [Candidatus Woesearchaeota archaeon]|nr:hypothetical protein [Candidatus Woesearchaeota archaeon]